MVAQESSSTLKFNFESNLVLLQVNSVILLYLEFIKIVMQVDVVLDSALVRKVNESII